MPVVGRSDAASVVGDDGRAQVEQQLCEAVVDDGVGCVAAGADAEDTGEQAGRGPLAAYHDAACVANSSSSSAASNDRRSSDDAVLGEQLCGARACPVCSS